MYRVTVSTGFSAAHRLRLPNGEYESWHGHNWSVEVSFVGAELDEAGLLIDFDEVRAALESVTGPLHRTSLNEAPLLSGLSPSTENVARMICEAVAERVCRPALLESVRVTEAPGCTAAYYRAGRPPASSGGPLVDDNRSGL